LGADRRGFLCPEAGGLDANVERPLRLTGIYPARAYTPNAIKALKETAERADAFCGIAARCARPAADECEAHVRPPAVAEMYM